MSTTTRNSSFFADLAQKIEIVGLGVVFVLAVVEALEVIGGFPRAPVDQPMQPGGGA